jgi:hypothetical protein
MSNGIGFLAPVGSQSAQRSASPFENFQTVEVFPQPEVNLTLKQGSDLGREVSRITFRGRMGTPTREQGKDLVAFISEKVRAENDFVREQLTLSRSGGCQLSRTVAWYKSEQPVFDADDFFRAAAQFLTGVVTVLFPALPLVTEVTSAFRVENIEGNTLMFNPPSHRPQLRTSCRVAGPVQRVETIQVENRDTIGNSLLLATVSAANEILNTFQSCELDGHWGRGRQMAYIEEDEMREIFHVACREPDIALAAVSANPRRGLID